MFPTFPELDWTGFKPIVWAERTTPLTAASLPQYTQHILPAQEMIICILPGKYINIQKGWDTPSCSQEAAGVPFDASYLRCESLPSRLDPGPPQRSTLSAWSSGAWTGSTAGCLPDRGQRSAPQRTPAPGSGPHVCVCVPPLLLFLKWLTYRLVFKCGIAVCTTGTYLIPQTR